MVVTVIFLQLPYKVFPTTQHWRKDLQCCPSHGQNLTSFSSIGCQHFLNILLSSTKSITLWSIHHVFSSYSNFPLSFPPLVSLASSCSPLLVSHCCQNLIHCSPSQPLIFRVHHFAFMNYPC